MAPATAASWVGSTPANDAADAAAAPIADPDATVTTAVPMAAPPERPKTNGSASGLRSKACKGAPAAEGAAPTSAASSTRGRRSRKSTVASGSRPCKASRSERAPAPVESPTRAASATTGTRTATARAARAAAERLIRRAPLRDRRAPPAAWARDGAGRSTGARSREFSPARGSAREPRGAGAHRRVEPEHQQRPAPRAPGGVGAGFAARGLEPVAQGAAPVGNGEELGNPADRVLDVRDAGERKGFHRDPEARQGPDWPPVP